MEIEAKSVFFTKIIKGDKIYIEISQKSCLKIKECYGTMPSKGEKGVKKLKKEELKPIYQGILLK